MQVVVTLAYDRLQISPIHEKKTYFTMPEAYWDQTFPAVSLIALLSQSNWNGQTQGISTTFPKINGNQCQGNGVGWS